MLAKTNLLTSSQPGLANLALRLLRGPGPLGEVQLGPTSTLFPDPSDPRSPESLRRLTNLLQLIWEVSVVRSGGFFLRYADRDGKPLPVRIFTPKGQPDPTDGIPSGDTATLTLVVTFPSSNRFERWHNAFTFSKDKMEGTIYLGVADASGTALQVFQPSYPPGCVGFEANWALAHLLTRDSSSLFDEDWVAALYHLMQFQVSGQKQGSTPLFGQSLWSLALSPSTDSSGPVSSDLDRPEGFDPEQQTYRQVVPVYRSVLGAGKDPSLYSAVGGRPNLLFKLNDVFGNALDDDTFATDFAVLYNDPLILPTEWPGVATAYRIGPDLNGAASLEISLLFDPSLVIRGGAAMAMLRVHGLPEGTEPTDEAKVKQQAEVALSKYATVAAQLADPNTSLSLTQSVLPANGGVVGDGAAIKATLGRFVDQVIEQLQLAIDGGQPAKVPLLLAVPLQKADLANRKDNIFSVTVSLTLSRPPELVDPQARAGMPRAVAAVMAIAADLDPPPQGTRRAQLRAAATGDPPPADVGLTDFATQFEAAFTGFDGADGTARLTVRSDVANLSAPRGTRRSGVYAGVRHTASTPGSF